MYRYISTAIILASLCAAANASITVATFADPSGNASNPLFTVTASTVSGSWTGNNLNLIVADDPSGSTSTTYTNTHMSMAATAYSGTTVSAGTVVFKDSTDTTTLLTVNWGSAIIVNPLLLGASYLNSNNVSFGGAAVTGLGTLTNQQFSFSFANPATVASGMTYTSSFTSSATPVPEPFSLSALTVAGIAALARRRRS